MSVPAAGRAPYWDAVHGGRDPSEQSWFQAEPRVSLALLEALGAGADAGVVDVGGGSSPLVDRLLDRGFRDLTVLDVSAAAIARARERLGARAAQVAWVVADVTAWVPGRRFDVWHDRAVLHFLVEPGDHVRYRAALEAALDPGGVAVVATFASDGPETCSGLPVVRYEAADLGALLGPSFRLVATRREEHRTPGGAVQPFVWAAFRRRDM